MKAKVGNADEGYFGAKTKEYDAAMREATRWEIEMALAAFFGF